MSLPDDQHREDARVFVTETGVRVLVTTYLEREDHPVGRGDWKIVDVTVALKGRDDGVWGPPLDETKTRWSA